jgi:hypothetical protein
MHPERITAIISQNGNACEEGLSEGWNPIRAYWQDSSQANREALRQFLTPETTRWQYVHGVTEESTVNVALYPTFQQYFRTHQPPLLPVWGKNDPFFLPAGARW